MATAESGRCDLDRSGRMRQLDAIEMIGQIALIAALSGSARIEVGIASQRQRKCRPGDDLHWAGEIEIAVSFERKSEQLAGDVDLEGAAQTREVIGDEALYCDRGYRPLGPQPQRGFAGHPAVIKQPLAAATLLAIADHWGLGRCEHLVEITPELLEFAAEPLLHPLVHLDLAIALRVAAAQFLDIRGGEEVARREFVGQPPLDIKGAMRPRDLLGRALCSVEIDRQSL